MRAVLTTEVKREILAGFETLSKDQSTLCRKPVSSLDFVLFVQSNTVWSPALQRGAESN